MSDQPSNPLVRYATFILLGAGLGAFLVYLFGEWLGMESMISGAVGGGVAGVISAYTRSKAGLDK